MREQPDLSDTLRREVNKKNAELSRIETRSCESSHHWGVEYTFYGSYVPIRPIIEAIAEYDDFAIEQLNYVNESTEDNDYEPHLNVFVADLRDEQPHPAFTEAYL